MRWTDTGNTNGKNEAEVELDRFRPTKRESFVPGTVDPMIAPSFVKEQSSNSKME
jgi:hypothetical protein